MNKKIIISLIVVVAILAASCFALKKSVNSKIEAKIEEIRSSGFNISYNERFSIFSVKADGKLEITNSKEALNYIVSLQEYEEQREDLQRVVESIDEYTLMDIFEGMVYDYDFSVNLISSGVDLNLYLTKLSSSLMEEIENARDQQKVQILVDMLENRDIHFNIDEKLNYKFKDIDLSNEDFQIVLKGLYGTKNSTNIDLYEFNVPEEGLNLKLEKIKVYYEENSKKEMISKFSVEKINFFAERFDFELNKLNLDSYSKTLENLLASKTNISFDKFSLNRVNYYAEEELKTELNNINLNIDLNQFPFQEYKDFLNAYATMNIDMYNFFEKGQILLQAISEAKSNINIKASSKDFILENLNIFKELGIDGDILVSPNLAEMNFSTPNNLFDKLYFEIKVDKESVQNAINNGNFNRNDEIRIIETEDKKYNLFKIELKEKGVFVNDSFQLR
ncbi:MULTISPECIES: hypothetical protein [Arcobacteraceae]|uniref:DUF945 domain-containing protein n=2 Tax=Arcobacteraceae TaxID=2808963 RepID=A0ABX2YBI6_9BACT|nr:MULTISPECIES: hypothetical protein [Arcobacteraceae]OCL90783.1 hypothetical protein AAX28_01600 [Arcobacter porcinus]OCL95805.1 hypothetical protein AA347_01287 [Aliarcobacter thereius LMG 24486]QBF16221.1 hypothetical protein ATH_1166 [Aliarcobacter thereius LMG 24486]TLS92155.1 DUF945 domain-containing protein [Aliarcobacter thereius]